MSPHKNFGESDDDYHERIAREANERTIEDSTGSAPKRKFGEDDDDYDVRIRKIANEQIIASDSGSAPAKRFGESDHDYRSRIAHKAREIRAREPSDSSIENGSSSPCTNDSDSGCSPSGSSSPSSDSGGYGGFIALMIVAVIVWTFVNVTGIWQKLQGTVEPVSSSQTGQLFFDGECSYSINREDNTVTIRVNRIVNGRPDGHSGSIRLGLYAMDEPYKGGIIPGSVGRVLRPHLLEPLKGGWSYSNISMTDKNEAAFKAGATYFLTLALLEHQNDNDYIVAWTSFPNPYKEPKKESWWKMFSRKDHPAQYCTDKTVASSLDGFIATAERENEANRLANKTPMSEEVYRKFIIEEVEKLNVLTATNTELRRQLSLLRYAHERAESNVAEKAILVGNGGNGDAIDGRSTRIPSGGPQSMTPARPQVNPAPNVNDFARPNGNTGINPNWSGPIGNRYGYSSNSAPARINPNWAGPMGNRYGY